MPTATFRAAVLRHLDVRRTEAGPICRAKFSATYSDNLIEQMSALEWASLPSSSSKMDLDGELVGGQNFVLTPNGDLKVNEIDVPCISAGKFSVFRVKDGDSTETEIRFEVLTNDPITVSKLWDYMKVIGEGAAMLKIRYTAQATTQEPAEEAEEPADERQLTIIDAPPPKTRRAKAEVTQ